MQRIVPITIAVALLATVAPIGAAKWSTNGDSEPSTRYDVPSLMFQNPSTDQAAKRIYFNGFAVEYLYFANPNVATLETRNEIPGIETMYAVLGMWTDCNGDGYVGLAESAAREYDAAILDIQGVNHCPPGTGDVDHWDNTSHNYNGWVSELIPIGNGDVDTEFNTRQFSDADVMIWADNARPDQPSTTGGGNCPVNPQPRGTFQSTGGFLNYADCSTGLIEAMNLPWSDSFRLGGQDVPGIGDPAGLRIADDDDARGHPTWDQGTFGSEDRSRSAVYLADCEADPLFYSGDTLNDTAPGGYDAVQPVPLINWNTVYNITVLSVPANPVSSDPTSATVAGTYNETFNDCDYDDAEGEFYGQFEDEEAPTRLFGKAQAGFNFEWVGPDSRGHDENMSILSDEEDVLGLGDENGDEVVIDSPYHPGRAGVAYFGGLRANGPFFAEWWGGTNLIKGPPNTVAARTNLGEGTADPGPDGAYWLSYFAFVGPTTTDKGLTLPGGSGIYGSTQCGAETSGIHNGWDCDAANWNLDTEGQPITSTHRLATVGDVYNLVDVDCADGGNNLGVGLGVPFYGEEACSTFA